MAPFVYTAGPNTALIKSSGRKDVRLIIGGRMFALPVFQRVDRLGLELRTIIVNTKRGTTKNGVAVDVTSCCQVKIQGWSAKPTDQTESPETSTPAGGDLSMDHSAIRLAAQHFIGKNDKEIEDTIRQTVAGHQRAIVGMLTVEELYKDRKEFSKQVRELCSNDMRNMGLFIVSYTVAEITDEHGYIEALGVTQTESVKRKANEGRAVHENQAKTRQALEERESLVQVNKQKEVVIGSDLARDRQEYEANAERKRMKVVEEKAKEIESARQDELVLTQRQRSMAAERKEQMLVMQEEVNIARLHQEKVTHVPADAKLYASKMERKKVEEIAEAIANKTRIEGMGSADAEAAMIERRGKAKAEQDALYAKRMGEAEAEAIKARGMAQVEVKLAEAKAIKARGMAEVEVLRERLKMWKECGNQGIIMEKIIEQLPKIAGAIAAPLSKTEKMVFVGSDGNGGPSQFTKSMNKMVAEVPETVSALTGVDLGKAISNFANSPGGQEVMRGFAEGGAEAIGHNAMKK